MSIGVAAYQGADSYPLEIHCEGGQQAPALHGCDVDGVVPQHEVVADRQGCEAQPFAVLPDLQNLLVVVAKLRLDLDAEGDHGGQKARGV